MLQVVKRSLKVARMEPLSGGQGSALSDKVTTTPLLVQDGFGFGGASLPDDGLNYCGPTALTMSLLWLGKNGWNQIGPAAPAEADALALDLVVSGLAGTSPLGGTNDVDLQNAVLSYLSAKGIAPSSASFPAGTFQPSVSGIAQLNQAQTVVTLLIGWYTPQTSGSNTYVRNGGHFVTVLSQDVGSGQITIANPCPSSLQPVADTPNFVVQDLATADFTGTTADLPAPADGTYYIQFVSGYPGATVAAVIEKVYALTVDMSEQSVNDPPIAPWTLLQQQTVDTNGADIAVSAAIQGASYGICKQGVGALVLQSTYTSTGPNQISGGRWVSNQSSGSPFGTGSMQMTGGTLSVDPGGSGSTVNVSIASDDQQQIALDGTAVLELNVGGHQSLAVSLGTSSSGGVPGIDQSGTGSLIIAIDKGVSQLGASCVVTVPAGLGSLVAASGWIAPWIVSQDPFPSLAFNFLSATEDGLGCVAYGASEINDSTASDMCAVASDQTVASGATAEAFALVVNGCSLSGADSSSNLQIGSQQSGQTAGLIMNGGSLSGLNLDFGSADAAIWVSDKATIDVTSITCHQLTMMGTGSLTLVGADAFGGESLVQSGFLSVPGTLGTAQSVTTVQSQGMLSVSGSVGGAVSASQGGTIVLSGGTVGGIGVDPQSYLAGLGTISGDADVDGQILVALAPGQIEFTGATNFSGSTVFVWSLFDLVDGDPSGSDPDWNTLSFTSSGNDICLGSEGSGVNVLVDMTRLGDRDPNSDVGFWKRDHQWTIFTAPHGFDEIYYNMLAPAFVNGRFNLNHSDDWTAAYITYSTNASS